MSNPRNIESSQSYADVASSTISKGFENEFTPLSEIPVGVTRLVSAFHNTQKTHSVQYRLNQLRNVYFILKDNTEELANALDLDFHRSTAESKAVDIGPAMNELLHTIANVGKWAKPVPVGDLPKSMSSNTVYIERVPFGTVLVIAPFNYPFLLSLGPISGAIAAGNNVVYKPSESTPHFSKLFSNLLSSALDPEVFFAVQGAVPETTLLLEQKFDKIFYTGNTAVGTIIAKKAAETLTPYVLELGGKSPTFILEDVKDKDISTIARRVAWGRFVNGGQSCVAPDYVLVHESIRAKFVKEIVRIVSEEFYPNLDQGTSDFTHAVHARAFNNLLKIISNTRGEIVLTGAHDPKTNFVYPTIVDKASWDDSTMRSEIFGPILPIISYSNLSDVLDQLQKRHDTPLAQYIFTSGGTSRASNSEINQILTAVRSGSTVVNDVVIQVGLPDAPFGGVGSSGTGSYHGIHSFRTFSHERTTVESPLWTEFTNAPRYPPYNKKKEILCAVAFDRYNGRLWFDRSGDVSVKGPNGIFSWWTNVAGFSALMYYFAKGI